MQIFAIVVSLAIAAVGIALFVQAIRSIIATIRIGQPTAGRTDHKAARWTNMLKETLGHTRMLQWTAMGVGHWFVFIGFGLLFFTLLTAFGQLFDPHFALPLIGHFFLYEWVSELFTVGMLIAIVAFIGYRATRPKERTRGAQGPVLRLDDVAGLLRRVGHPRRRPLHRGPARRGVRRSRSTRATAANALHYPFSVLDRRAVQRAVGVARWPTSIYLVAMVKIVISFTWMIVISPEHHDGRRLAPVHRVLQHLVQAQGRRRHRAGRAAADHGRRRSRSTSRTSRTSTRTPPLGVGKDRGLRLEGHPRLHLVHRVRPLPEPVPGLEHREAAVPQAAHHRLRDHAYAKAPYLLAAEDERDGAPRAHVTGRGRARRWSATPRATDSACPSGAAVIDPDVLWSCTIVRRLRPAVPRRHRARRPHRRHAPLPGARRVELPRRAQRPVQGPGEQGQPLEHVAQRPDGLGQGPADFEVKQVGEDVEDLDEVDWLFWVGCAGAYEDRAKKTTRAVAELLDMAGVSFAVLGDGETCTGDPARRAGNEFVFQQLAHAERRGLQGDQGQEGRLHLRALLQHAEERVRRVRRRARGRAPHPAAQPAGPRGQADPGRRRRPSAATEVDHLPRPLLPRPAQPGLRAAARAARRCCPDAEFAEMPRNTERSFCCGAGGARMWMEEKIGERINVNRTTEAVATGADQIAVGCPFCRVMLSDGLTVAAGRRRGPRGGRGPRRRADAARLGQATRGRRGRRGQRRGGYGARVGRHGDGAAGPSRPGRRRLVRGGPDPAARPLGPRPTSPPRRRPLPRSRSRRRPSPR